MSEAIKPTLLPCPFCGGEARDDAHADDCYFVLHRRLNAASNADMSLHLEALDAWNRRSYPLVERVKELEEALQGLDEAYCRAGSPLTREERFEDRKRLIAARAALSKSLPNTVAEVQ